MMAPMRVRMRMLLVTTMVARASERSHMHVSLGMISTRSSAIARASASRIARRWRRTRARCARSRPNDAYAVGASHPALYLSSTGGMLAPSGGVEPAGIGGT